MRRERGVVAVVVLLAILALGASYYMVQRLDAMTVQAKSAERSYNAAVLNRAKRALIGYVAAQAVKAGENNPGALPCPEAAAYFDDPDNEGKVASSCTLPKVGRLPWRTLGLEKLLDAAGEPLWYVVSPGWARTSGNTNINSNTVGQLTLDGATGTDSDTVVALIIAPGPAINVAAATGCTAWTQTRPTTGAPDWRNYLECENATSPADNVFVTTGPSGSFNDQVIKLTKGDIMPAIEAAIANRIEREIVPPLKAVYGTSTWGLSSTNPLFPYASPFANPSTSNYQGTAGTTSGLLPMTSQTCTGDARCSTTFVAWNQTVVPTLAKTGGLGNLLGGSACSFLSATQVQCTGRYRDDAITIAMTVRANNVAMALLQLDATQATSEYQNPGWISVTSSPSGAFPANDGSANIVISASFPSLPGNTNMRITMNIGILADHSLLDSTDATTGWFVRNEWYRLLYYATASGHTATVRPGSLPACATGSTCLSVANVMPSGAQRAILILAGRSIDGSTRPSATLANYLEFGNATSSFERQTVSSAVAAAGLKTPFNDRLVVVDSN
jgi:hypothetical protein